MTDALDIALTARQHAVLEVIRSSVSERGYPPSIRELGEAVGLASLDSVSYQLRALERKGYLRRDPGSPRAITITAPADSSVCPTCGRGGKEHHA